MISLRTMYKLIIENKILIPLWHDELVYEHNNSDIYIKNIPSLPNNISIDNNNNIIVLLHYNIKEIWNNDIIYFNIETKFFYNKR